MRQILRQISLFVYYKTLYYHFHFFIEIDTGRDYFNSKKYG